MLAFVDAKAMPLEPLSPSEPNSPAPPARAAEPSVRSVDPADPTGERLLYFGRLKVGLEKEELATTEEARTEEAKSALMIPSERLMQGKDHRVMARWLERQRDWERLQHNIAEKLGRDETKMLMNESNDFRERFEEYELLQAAVPPQERNQGTMWEMSLRNGGTRLIPIGNIFSGLFCPLKAEVPVPKVIRRPRLALAPQHTGKTWRNDDALVVLKQRMVRICLDCLILSTHPTPLSNTF